MINKFLVALLLLISVYQGLAQTGTIKGGCDWTKTVPTSDFLLLPFIIN